ncbi:MAG: phosphotriesterase, partial [Pyrinomonadaceae bacterium]|nr:phosphotriesterase [Pyrinomonadaceae bacterium]
MTQMISRRVFISAVTLPIAGTSLAYGAAAALQRRRRMVMTVRGPIDARNLGTTLMHEHVMVDFVGADKVSRERYDAEDVFSTALPYLKRVASLGCRTLVDCTPAYIGRDAQLLKRLSEATGLNIITTTGYYG